MKCVVLLPHGKIAQGKLAQALMYGATTISIQGNFDQALTIVRELGDTGKVEVVNSINPVRIEGQKTASFEICDQLGRAPDFHFLPVGNAGNITAYWRGYREYHKATKIDRLPQMFDFRRPGAAPMVTGKLIADPQTVASAIRIGNPASWIPARQALQESNGFIDSVTDTEILAAYKLIARTDGVFVEPASAACLAGLIKCVKARESAQRQRGSRHHDRARAERSRKCDCGGWFCAHCGACQERGSHEGDGYFKLRLPVLPNHPPQGRFFAEGHPTVFVGHVILSRQAWHQWIGLVVKLLESGSRLAQLIKLVLDGLAIVAVRGIGVHCA